MYAITFADSAGRELTSNSSELHSQMRPSLGFLDARVEVSLIRSVVAADARVGIQHQHKKRLQGPLGAAGCGRKLGGTGLEPVTSWV